jgi:hypothetical protein
LETILWIKGEGRIGEYARNHVVEEVIAFANAFGGTLIIGISETETKPHKAASIVPIPNCAELAERLRLQCRDCIEPQIQTLEIAGVATDTSGAGVVVIRVPRSRLAPHRHTVTKECYVRRADRCEKMSMREIQDMTLNVMRGLADVDAKFEKRHQLFRNRMEASNRRATFCFGLRATLIPLTLMHIERVFANVPVYPPIRSFHATLGTSASFELSFYSMGGHWRPSLRSAVNTDGDGDSRFHREVHCDGLIEYEFTQADKERELSLFPESFMCVTSNALLAADKFRCEAGTPNVEYGMEIELFVGAALPVTRYGRKTLYGPAATLTAADYVFPRYSVSDRKYFPELAALIERDFWHAGGRNWDEAIRIDFES